MGKRKDGQTPQEQNAPLTRDEKRQKKVQEELEKKRLKTLRDSYKVAAKLQQNNLMPVKIDGKTLSEVKAILDAADAAKNSNHGQAGGARGRNGGGSRLSGGHIDSSNGDLPVSSPSDDMAAGPGESLPCTGMTVQSASPPTSEAGPGREEENSGESSEESSEDEASLEEAVGMQSVKVSAYGTDESEYAAMVRKCNNSQSDGSMFLTHSEDDETNSAIMCVPGKHAKKKDKLDWNVIYQPGFLIPPSNQEDCPPIYFCNCTPECTRVKMQAEMLLGYTTLVEHNPQEQVVSGSCDHITALQSVVKHSGMTAIQFANSVRQTCKYLSYHCYPLAWPAGQAHVLLIMIGFPKPAWLLHNN